MFDPKTLKVYFIAGSQDIADGNLISVVEEALKAGITMFQFREKGETSKKGAEKEALAKSLFELCKQYQVPFIVNDDVDLAIKLNADGIHVGQDDRNVSDFKDKFKDKIIGLSVANKMEYDQSDISEVDYIGTGPIHSTNSKADAGEEGGYQMIENMRKINQNIPIVAIGGITEVDVQPLIKAGANGVSVISAIAKSQNIEQTVKGFHKQYKNI
ncbi:MULTISPECIES: thiamine phosphate synthase [Mammaliicoccus]|uniref:thiamine phosphate synthase n=1 Tax=Mammaliicoccus TaxID=2803850 RepID=UPI0009C2B78C|nr:MULTISPECIES: thiamine phosphate synthase [Mammaliicoccus]ARB40240.1 thiamine-phosphate diphosphorylase [Mammaliicoccus sciuri]MCE5041569.1 thiamine phosphate synthase [Mammaliicoccus sciuri]MCE5058702.1 thiamine phosphate synthase [Mammaliicoccus sciuri]MDT0670108.1 thiamine phosphate synthase [Mammaliicoccus sciuri]MEB5648821.1 thiamine phosphate synthase [Mammaliicoccus sciuri]